VHDLAAAGDDALAAADAVGDAVVGRAAPHTAIARDVWVVARAQALNEMSGVSQDEAEA
jgi:hypothetical protein